MKNEIKFTQRPAFINRQYELDFLRAFIQDTPNRLLFMYGPKSSGKTTLMSQFILQTINQNKKVYFYNGELGEEFLKDWLFLQASGGNGIERIEDTQFGVYDYAVNDETYKKIDNWLDKKFKFNLKLIR